MGAQVHLLVGLCSRFFASCGSNSVGYSTSKFVATWTTEKSTFIVITSTNCGQLSFGWFPTPFTHTATWGIINGDRSTKFIV